MCALVDCPAQGATIYHPLASSFLHLLWTGSLLPPFPSLFPPPSPPSSLLPPASSLLLGPWSLVRAGIRCGRGVPECNGFRSPPSLSSPSSLLPPPSSLFSPLSSLVPPPSSVFGSGLDGSECNGFRLEGLERFFMVLDLTGRDRGGGVVLTKKYGKKL